MSAASISFDGFDRVEATVLSIAEDVGYVTLYERLASGRSRRIDQIQVTAQALAEYLERLPALDEAIFDDEFSPEDEHDGSEAPESLEDAFAQEESREWTALDLLRATLLWVHETAVRAAEADHTERFWLRYQAPKGTRALCTLTFSVRNPPWTSPRVPAVPAQQAATRAALASAPSPVAAASPPPVLAPSPSRRLPTNVLSEQDLPGLGAALPAGAFIMPATFQDGSLYGTAGAFRVLGDSYQEYGRIMMAGVSQLQGMMREVVKDLGTDLRESRIQVGSLVDKVLEGRVQEVEAQEQAIHSQESGQRMLLAREALAQIGDVARAFFVSRGVSPELGDVAGLIASSPSLMTSLQDPKVKSMLEKPENLEALGSMLKQFAGQAAELESAATGPGPSNVGPAPASAPSAVPPNGQPVSGRPDPVPPPPMPPTGAASAFSSGVNPPGAYPPAWNGSSSPAQPSMSQPQSGGPGVQSGVGAYPGMTQPNSGVGPSVDVGPRSR